MQVSPYVMPYLPMFSYLLLYREPVKGLQILLSRIQAGPGTAVKQDQEEISPNHVQAISGASVSGFHTTFTSRKLSQRPVMQ